MSRLLVILSILIGSLGLVLYARLSDLTLDLLDQFDFLDDQWPYLLRKTAVGHDASNALDHGEWDILYHMGGNSPWIPRLDGAGNNSLDAPPGCRIEQVHMMARHAERYPTAVSGTKMLALYNKIQESNVTLQGDLGFANTWDFFMSDPYGDFEDLVSTGQYAGTLQAFATGTKLRTRYRHLLKTALRLRQTTFWTSGSHRVIETAKNFAAAFFGIDWQDSSTLQIISESPKLGGNTLTPGRTCTDFATNANDKGHDLGVRKLFEWRSVYLPPIIGRLQIQNPNITFTESEVYSMQELCGFETIARGHSPWCDVFTHDEWEQFEYARDLLHYYRAGPGNPYSRAMGYLWLNATTQLLAQGPEAGPLFLSFVHDGDIIPLLSTLSLFPSVPSNSTLTALPTTHLPANRTWRTSTLVPMGGRIILERLACPAHQDCWSNEPFYPNHVYCEPLRDEYFVRINVNDAVVEIPWCSGKKGPGGSCRLEEFVRVVEGWGREEGVGDFGRICGLEEEGREGGVEFLHQ